MAFFKAGAQIVHYLRDFRARELQGVDADQALEAMVEVDQVEFDPPAPDARDRHLATADTQRPQAWFEHRPSDGVEHKVDPSATGQSAHLAGQIGLLCVDEDIGVRGSADDISADDSGFLPVRDLGGRPTHRS
jgi:hypothetical protein